MRSAFSVMMIALCWSSTVFAGLTGQCQNETRAIYNGTAYRAIVNATPEIYCEIDYTKTNQCSQNRALINGEAKQACLDAEGILTINDYIVDCKITLCDNTTGKCQQHRGTHTFLNSAYCTSASCTDAEIEDELLTVRFPRAANEWVFEKGYDECTVSLGTGTSSAAGIVVGTIWLVMAATLAAIAAY
jgi:hypothetical protein